MSNDVGSWRIDYFPRIDRDEYIMILGPETKNILRPNQIEGFSNPRGKLVQSIGPGLSKGSIREVQTDTSHEVVISGSVLDSPESNIEDTIKYYARMLDYSNNETPSGWVPGKIRYSDELGIFLYRTAICTNVNFPRSAAMGNSVRRFDFRWEAIDPYWSTDTKTQALVSGNNTVVIQSKKAVYPVISITTTGSGASNIIVTSNTHVTAGVARAISILTSFPAGAKISITMDPQSNIPLAYRTDSFPFVNLQEYLLYGDKRWKLWNGSNSINLSYTGTLTASISWIDVYPGV